MSGHSKWATIKHKKAAIDAKRGKVFSKLAKELTISARSGGGDPGANITLRTILGKCKAVNMPADNIERAIKKGTGELEGAALEERTFEAYAAGGVGFVIQCLTDNQNRSVAEVRHTLQRHNATLAGSNQVLRNFQRRGQILVDAEGVDEDALTELVLDAGADDMTREGDEFEILTDPAVYNEVSDKVTTAGYKISEESGVNMIPLMWQPVSDPNQASSVLKLVDALEELDDVQNVYMNADIADDAMPAEDA
jgi:YebC/PmpR family DNA-binding regulatory protein